LIYFHKARFTFALPSGARTIRIFASFCILTGCAQVQPGIFILKSNPDYSRDGAALESASDQFFGGPHVNTVTQQSTATSTQSSSTTSSSNPAAPTIAPPTSPSTSTTQATAQPASPRISVGFRANALYARDNQSLERSYSGFNTIGGYLSKPIGSETKIRLTGAYTTGKTSYFLPNGYGILSDPTTISFDHDKIDVQLSILRTMAQGAYVKLDVESGVGLQSAWTATSIQSALLDIQNLRHSKDPYVTFGLALRPAAPIESAPFVARIDAKTLANSPAQFSAQIGLEF
jgi:hypothetical protein